MLYKKNGSESLDPALFAAPTAEYRGAPFWAWNGKLDREQLTRQVHVFKEMGFGGFHMHSRTGMATPYLSKEFMDCVRACTDEAKAENMLAWLYDEDRWASGAAGGFVTQDKALRRKRLVFEKYAPDQILPKDEAYKAGKPYFLAAFQIELDENGFLKSYTKETPDLNRDLWYASVYTDGDDPWFNNQAYPDLSDRAAVKKFIEITYEAYKKCVGAEFGKTVPAIFTDEPNLYHSGTLFKTDPFANERIELPWGAAFEEEYRARYGEELIRRLPELVWLCADRRDAAVRYRFWDLCASLFEENFSAQCGKWCEENGIALTGHLLREAKMTESFYTAGDLMRQYRSFTLPGIDMLCNFVELTTAKQCQSVVHQTGKEGMMSELYGVTNWDFDFRGHKFQGDWQAALGVTVRVPHLSWMTMEGEAKRDYPASIFYQSPWYKEYAYVEDHFARLNTALTRGKPIVKIGVIHPIESMWIMTGPTAQSGDRRATLEENFQTVTRWLLEGHLDFNFINEAMLPALGAPEARRVGKMEYEAIVVPDCETLRASTVDYLTAFMEHGGRVLFMSECPRFIGGVRGDGARALYERAEKIPFVSTALTGALAASRTVEIADIEKMPAKDFLYQLRQDGADQWLFIARMCPEPLLSTRKERHSKDEVRRTPLTVTVNGLWEPQIYDTLSGKILPADFEHRDGKTVIRRDFYASDSLLLRLSAPHYDHFTTRPAETETLAALDYKTPVETERSEPNVLLLDRAEWKLDDGEWQPEEEILRLDNAARESLGMPLRNARVAQPWVWPEEPAAHTVTLRYTVSSEIRLREIRLAAERPDTGEFLWNGKPVAVREDGWFTDECIRTFPLPGLKKGENVLTVKLPLSKRSNLEALYLLGEFDVRLAGASAVITAGTSRRGFGGVETQGLPFYGGNITYILPVEAPALCEMSVHCGKYAGALCRVSLDGGESKPLAFAPYTAVFRQVEPGRHTLRITVYGNRFNTFGCLHNCAEQARWVGPNAWRTMGDSWCYEYRPREFGLLISPRIRLYKTVKENER